jgi:hypothetical protein
MPQRQKKKKDIKKYCTLLEGDVMKIKKIMFMNHHALGQNLPLQQYFKKLKILKS